MNQDISPLMALSIVEAENVLPRKNKSPASLNMVQNANQIFDPDNINIQAVAGDFNSVVELSADFCLGVFDLAFERSVYQLTIEPEDLKTFFSSQTTAFDSPTLNQLAATDPTKTTYINGLAVPPKGLTVLIYFTPISLVFGSGQSLTITYQAAVSVGALLPLPEKGDSLGLLTVVISASWTDSPDAGLKQLDMYVDLTSATISISNGTSDAKRMYDGGLFGENGATIANFLLYRAQVQLTPTISLVGKDSPANVGVPELPDFQTQVSVVQWFGRQALAAAFQVNPGCSPDIADVVHFIGLSDYGVISDEFLISGVLHHKWDLGGFLRIMPFHEDINVKVNGNPETATLYGAMTLETLDSVSLDSDSNARTDCITLAGTASVAAQYLVLPDNTMVTAGEQGVDFGTPENTGWGLKTSPAVQVQLPQAPLARDFMLQAYQEAYRHLGRPFARFPDPIGGAKDPLYVNYVRVSAVAQRMVSLAAVSELFL